MTLANKLGYHHPGTSDTTKRLIEPIIDQAGNILGRVIAKMLSSNQGDLAHIGRKT